MRLTLVFPRICLVALLLLQACISARPATKASRQVHVASVLVMDSDDSRTTAPVPQQLSQRVLAALDAHNFQANELAASEWNDAYTQKRTTAARLQVLAAQAPQAEALVLVETKPAFYSLLSGRFRWTVRTRVTFAKKDDLRDPLTAEFELPVFLDFEHEREPQALETAASSIADEVSRVADQFVTDVLDLGPVPVKKPSGRAPPKKAATLPKRPTRVPQRTDESIYFVLVDRFENGDKTNDGAIDLKDPQAFHGGDLQGVINRLDYLQGLGVRTVWLSPVFKMRTQKLDEFGAFHGYWVEDFGRIEPRFGDEALLKQLSDELHARGMKLVLDVVLNHVGYDAPLVKEHPEWFHHNGDIEDWNDRNQLETYDVHGLPDLAQEREDVYQYLLATSLKWIDSVHPDGFRLDAVKHVPLSFWARYNEDIRKHAGKDFLLLGEDLDGDPQRLAKTLSEGKFTSVFDFPLHFAMVDVFCKDAPAGKLAATLYQDRNYAHPEQLATLLDNHDLARIQSSCKGDQKRVHDALAFLLLTRGVPTLMYGTESGLEGETEPENRADMVWENPAYKDLIQRLLAVRREHASLFEKRCEPLVVKERLYSCAYVTEDEALVLTLNQQDKGEKLVLFGSIEDRADIASATDPLTNEPARIAKEYQDITFKSRPGTFQAVHLRAAPGINLASHFHPAWRDIEEYWKKTPGMHLKLVVDQAPLEAGDSLYVVGSGSFLGEWDPSKGIGPGTPDDHGLVVPVSMPPDAVLEYKLVIKKKNGSVVWEPRANRILRLVRQGLRLTWGGGESKYTPPCTF